MTITEVQEAGTTTWILVGRFDAHGSQVAQKHLDAAQAPAGGTVRMDFSAVPYLSSAGLRVLLLAKRKFEAAGARLVVASLQPYCLEVLRIGGLLSVLDIEAANPPGAALETPVGSFRPRPGRDGAGAIEVLGHIEDVLASRITAAHVKSKPFSAKEFSLGLGAMGPSVEDVLPRMGEMITIGGTMVWLPTDGNDTPDFLVPKAESEVVTIRTGFNASIAGPFNEFFEFRSSEPSGTDLAALYRALFDLAKSRRKDFRGCIALAMRADVEAAYGAGVLKSPIAEFAPANGKSITDPSNFSEWFEFDQEPRHGRLTGLISGVGIDLTADLDVFDSKYLGATFYINPANTATAGEMLHNHGVFFSPLPFPEPARTLDEEIAEVVETGDFLDMRHLLDRTRVSRALIGVVYVQEFRPDPASL
ncbi:MAG: STAS domain-containing protein [Terrimicrobiaceae bacterium]|nr:STAS domain-containing protein [Terrimicrobiaceae bacterium]